MTPWERLTAALADDGNRHGPDRACVPVSVAGGRVRRLWIERSGEGFRCTLYGNTVALVVSTGTVDVTASGHFTPSTRDALSWIIAGHDQAASLSTPGSRGGDRRGRPWELILYPRNGRYSEGQRYALTDTDPYGWITIPAEAFA